MSWMIHKMEVSLIWVNLLSLISFQMVPKELHDIKSWIINK